MFQAAGPVERVLWTIIIVLVVSFLVGSWLNRRRSKAIGRWLQGGLAGLGGQPSWKWLRGMSSGAQVTIEAATKPFRRLEINYFMVTRELPPLWAIEWLRGKRDMLAVRGELRDGPEREIEIVPVKSKLRQTLDAQSGTSLSWSEAPHGLSVGTRNGHSAEAARRLRPFLERYGAAIQRLSIRQRQPNVMLFANVSGLATGSSADFLRALRKIVGD